jgi:hypothetical protein
MTDAQAFRLFAACFAVAFATSLLALIVVTVCPVIL